MGALPQAALEHRVFGGTLFARGLMLAAAEEFQRWYDLVAESADPELILPPVNALATVCQRRLDHEGALAWLEMILPYAADPDANPIHATRVRINRLVSLVYLGRDEEALAEAAAAEELAQRTASPHLRGLVHYNLASLHVRQQEWVAARRQAQAAIEEFTVAGDQKILVDALATLGVAHLGMGALRLARRDLTRARNLAGEANAGTAYVYTELGRLGQAEGDLAEGFYYGTQALALLLADVSALDKEEVARVSELFGGLFAATGDRTLALKYLNRAAAYFSQLGRLAGWQRVAGRIQQVLTERPRPSSAALPGQVQRLDFLTAVLDLTDDLEGVDPYLRGHSERVATLAVLLGQAAELAPEKLRVLNYAARLHDVGKVAVEAEVLRKPGKLTPAEWERVRIHPVIGEEMLRPFGLDQAGLLAIRHHHEHWDGGGYPQGLAGEKIPYLARVIAVADVYDALTSNRVYRGAVSHSEALTMMNEMAGKVLDPDLVGLFLRLHRI